MLLAVAGGEPAARGDDGPSLPPAEIDRPTSVRAEAPPAASSDDRVLRRPAATAVRATGTAGTGAKSDAATWFRTAAALGGVIALILLLAWGYRAAVGNAGRFPLAARARNHGVLEIVARAPLSPRQGLCLVRVGPRLVLIGTSADGVAALDVIDDADLTARLVTQARGASPDSETARFRECLERESRPATAGDDDAVARAALRIADVRSRLAGTMQRLRTAAGDI